MSKKAGKANLRLDIDVSVKKKLQRLAEQQRRSMTGTIECLIVERYNEVFKRGK